MPKGRKCGSSQRALLSLIFSDVVKRWGCLFKVLQQEQPTVREHRFSEGIAGQQEGTDAAGMGMAGC